jgi:heptaprenyl diphosphate synthase
MNKNVKKMVLLAMFVTIALLLAYVESLLPPIWTAVPGIKVGLPNIIIVAALYSFGAKEACIVSFMRICIAALLFGTPLTFAYSFAGALLSLILMIACKKLNLFSTLGVSVVGGVSHNLGQILLAMIIFERAEIGYYMIVLTVTGILAGIFIGVAGSFFVEKVKQLKTKM